MRAIDFLKQYRIYEDETIYNSVGDIVGTLSTLMEEYAELHQSHIVVKSEKLNCSNCGRQLKEHSDVLKICPT